MYFGAQRAFLKIDRWNDKGGVMIDSGTTFTYLVSSEYRTFVQAFTTAFKEALVKAHKTIPSVKRFRVGDGGVVEE